MNLSVVKPHRTITAGGAAEKLPLIGEIAAGYAAGVASPEVVLDFFLERIAAIDGELNSFVCLNTEVARLAAAQSAARWRQNRPLSEIDGIPLSVKDMFDVAGLPSRRGSLTTSAEPVPSSAPAVQRLLNAGVVIVGLTTTAEYGGAPVTISPLTGITRNAWDPEHSAGGSSGGAAVSVAAGLCSGALASDTGGSIRIPSAFNGVVGLKPTGGRIPTDHASVLRTMGCPGPMARSVADCALLYSVLADPAYGAPDPTCPAPNQCPPLDIGQIRFVASRSLGYAAFLDEDVAAAFDRTLALLRARGASVREAEPELTDPIGLFQTYTRANYASIFADLDADGLAKLSGNVRDARAAGAGITAVELLAAARRRIELAERMQQALGPHDILLTPTVAVPAFAAESFMPDHPATKTNPRAWSPFGYIFNLTEQPALTMPMGLSRDGLPLGLQMVAGKWQEAMLLHAAEQLESLLQFDNTPPIKRGSGKLGREFIGHGK